MNFARLPIGCYYAAPHEYPHERHGLVPYQKISARFARPVFGDRLPFGVAGHLSVQKVSLLDILAIVASDDAQVT